MKRKAALALGIALIAVIVLCLFSCGHEEKPQADAPGPQTVSGTDADTEDESAAEDPAKDSESKKTDSEKDSKKDAAKDSSTTSTSTNKKTGSSTSGSNKTSSKTSSGSSSKTSGKTSSSSSSASGSSGKDYGQGTPKNQGNSGKNGSGNGSNGNGTKPDPTPQPQPQPTPDPPAPAADPMNWPSNEYTALLPRPSAGTVQQTDMQDGVYCLLLTGADMSDVKAYASALINAGYINEVTETVESGTYLFGGGNSNGNFVVVSYQNGQFIIGVQP